MLELHDISVEIPGPDGAKKLLSQVRATFPPGSFYAIIGPSGCGKTTLIKAVAGLLEPSEGSIHWQGRNLDEEDFTVGELAYVPQFSIAHESLTVAESIGFAVRLRIAGLDAAARAERAAQVLTEVGLDLFTDRPVRVLSGGQRRRLALALELISNPSLLLCDEVTSGLDPRAEDEIVRLLAALARHTDRTVLNVTHSLRQADCYDGITVLYQGHLAFHGPISHLAHYFSISDPEKVYDRLADHSADVWAEQWRLAQGGTP